jgi:uncharacterized lipoprotein YmbA
MMSRVAVVSRALALLVTLIVPLLLAACGHSPETQFLTLDPVPGAPAAAAWRGPPVRIPSVAVPPALDRVEFTRQTAPGEMKVDDLVHWSAPLGMLARNTLILDLAQRLPAGAVAPPDAPAQPGGLRVTVSILSFAVTGGVASMEAAYEIAGDDAAAATGPRQWVQLTAASAGAAPLDTARAFSTLLGLLADRMAVDIAGRR